MIMPHCSREVEVEIEYIERDLPVAKQMEPDDDAQDYGWPPDEMLEYYKRGGR